MSIIREDINKRHEISVYEEFLSLEHRSQS